MVKTNQSQFDLGGHPFIPSLQSNSQVFPRLWSSGIDQACTEGRGWKKTLRGRASLDAIGDAINVANPFEPQWESEQ